MTWSNKVLFHDDEMVFVGRSGAGKTTLLCKLIEIFSRDKFNVGYIKHDAHGFQMDKEGKDTFKAKKSGAKSIFINSSKHSAYILNENNDFLTKESMIDNDLVFIEGYKNSSAEKILVLNKQEDIELLNSLENVIAIVSGVELPKNYSVPIFHRNAINEIYEFLLMHFKKRKQDIPLFGLILAGGYSTRMKSDKTALQYFGRPQIDYTHDLLRDYCDRVYVSCGEEQKELPHMSHHHLLADIIINQGPAGGIYSAFKQLPKCALLVVACDLPFLNKETIVNLISKRNQFKLASAYLSEDNSLPEPLCTIYEPKAQLKLGQYLVHGKSCPRKILMNSRVEFLNLITENALENINTADQYQTTINQLQGGTL